MADGNQSTFLASLCGVSLSGALTFMKSSARSDNRKLADIKAKHPLAWITPIKLPPSRGPNIIVVFLETYNNDIALVR